MQLHLHQDLEEFSSFDKIETSRNVVVLLGKDMFSIPMVVAQLVAAYKQPNANLAPVVIHASDGTSFDFPSASFYWEELPDMFFQIMDDLNRMQMKISLRDTKDAIQDMLQKIAVHMTMNESGRVQRASIRALVDRLRLLKRKDTKKSNRASAISEVTSKGMVRASHRANRKSSVTTQFPE